VAFEELTHVNEFLVRGSPPSLDIIIIIMRIDGTAPKFLFPGKRPAPPGRSPPLRKEVVVEGRQNEEDKKREGGKEEEKKEGRERERGKQDGKRKGKK